MTLPLARQVTRLRLDSGPEHAITTVDNALSVLASQECPKPGGANAEAVMKLSCSVGLAKQWPASCTAI